MASIRKLIESLTSVATELPEGLDGSVEYAICDGKDLRIIENVDLDSYSQVAEGGAVVYRFAVIRGHLHGPDDGRTLPGISGQVEDDLRKITESGD